jgi:WD40 repeat protein/biotin carboxyl carrier protein
MWRTVGSLVAVAILIAVVFWWTRAGGRTDAAGTLEPLTVPGERPPAQPLTAAQGLPPRAAAGMGRALYDPVVVGPCNLVPLQEQDVSSPLDGILDEVAVHLGKQVDAGEVLGRLDDRLLRPEVESLRIKAASDAARLIATAQYKEAQEKADIAKKLLASGVSPSLEYKSLAHQRDRFAEEIEKAREDRAVAQQELDRVLRLLELHQVRSAIAGEVTRVYKRRGESVRQMEQLFCVADVNRLLVEGLCKVQEAKLLRVGMRALVEPEIRGEQMTELNGHTGAITGLAVSPDGRLIAAASTDRTVLLWGWPEGAPCAVLRHPAEVYAVAFAPAVSPGYRLLTGCADGRARLWGISARGDVEGPAVLPGGPGAAIRAVAFSLEGRRLAAGGEDKRLGVWDGASDQFLYWLGAEGNPSECAHQGAVTAIHFTPDGHLISAGRDNVLQVWELGDGGARLAARLPGRTGDAADLGISQDGGRVLFDQGDELRVLDWRAGTSVGSIRSRRQGRFQGFAAFSPAGGMILTASDNGRIQLWNVPATPEATRFFRQAYAHGFGRDSLASLGLLGSALTPAGFAPGWAAVTSPGPNGKGSVLPHLWGLDAPELRHFIAPGPSAVTCGTFAPDESVLFTGGADKAVRVWEVPSAAQRDQLLEAEITYLGSQVERGTNMVRVRAEFENPQDPALRLQPGTYAYLRLYPETAGAAARKHR